MDHSATSMARTRHGAVAGIGRAFGTVTAYDCSELHTTAVIHVVRKRKRLLD